MLTLKKPSTVMWLPLLNFLKEQTVKTWQKKLASNEHTKTSLAEYL